MFEPLKLGAWAAVDGRCPMRSIINNRDEVTLVFGSARDEFEFAFDSAALRNLLDLGAHALAEMESLTSEL
ncbi:hypothetical protein [Nocardia jejuensis]|uniref:hypothetical protein n=1 Tax=Nocardia jejuensis TaxID=328049 RepID=UPI00082E4CF4|nr:hypothetical protein [Nocardia jejuensis]